MRTTGPGTRQVGRPRAQGRAASGLTARQEVLAAAAELFTVHGYAATTTRAVAERAGLRQASLYHYFAGKEDILAALLEGTVRPSLELARDLVPDTGAGAEARLWALCRADVELLCGGAHDPGALYLLPEVRAERFTAFHQARAELKSCYGALLAATAPGAALDAPALGLRTDLVFGLIEGAILIRRQNPARSGAELAEAAADGALRLAGAAESAVRRARREGTALLRARATREAPADPGE